MVHAIEYTKTPRQILFLPLQIYFITLMSFLISYPKVYLEVLSDELLTFQL